MELPGIILSADNFRSQSKLLELLSSNDLRPLIGGVLLSQSMLSDHISSEQILRTCSDDAGDKKPLYVLADTQLAGGFPAVLKQALDVQRKHHPIDGLTVSAGTTFDILSVLEKGLTHSSHSSDVFLTAALPEVSSRGGFVEFRRDIKNYTQLKVSEAKRLHFAGVFGASQDAVKDPTVLFVGAGISPDGQDYEVEVEMDTSNKPPESTGQKAQNEKGLKAIKRATTPARAVELGCGLIVVGHAIADMESPEDALVETYAKMQKAA